MEGLISTTLDRVVRLCKDDFYDYIVIGSGMGGGILTRSLIETNFSRNVPRVLLIEHGGLLLNTHSANIATPRWNRGGLEEPAMDNALVYDALKDRFMTSTSNSDTYAGGPVYGIGGRSTVWGLYTPRVTDDDLDNFPEGVRKDLRDDRYDEAYRLMTNDPCASLSKPYPSDHWTPELRDIIEKIIRSLSKTPSCFRFELCPTAAEFNAGDPSSKLYRILQGGYSTVNWILDRVFNRSEYLHLLSRTRVISVNRSEHTVDSLTVVDQNNQERTFPIGKATVILSAGTIDTAAIALHSGLGKENDLVGRGLTDHDIWATRFRFQGRSDIGGLGKRALRLQANVKLISEDEETTANCLMNITINAPSFLGPKYDKSCPCQVIHLNKVKGDKSQYATVQVLFNLSSELVEENRVLNLPMPVPTIQVTKKDTSMYKQAMEDVAIEIRDKLCALTDECKVKQRPQVARGPFGVVAHEVGTMRMGESDKEGVVDSNLKVFGLSNLYVCDLSVFPFSTSANPSLTLAVLSQRLGSYLERQRKQQQEPLGR